MAGFFQAKRSEPRDQPVRGEGDHRQLGRTAGTATGHQGQSAPRDLVETSPDRAAVTHTRGS